MGVTNLVLVAAIVTGQAPDRDAAGKADRSPAAERLEFMKTLATSEKLEDKVDPGRTMEQRPEPAFRLGKRGDGVVLEAAILLWADPVGRPAAAAQVFLIQSAAKIEGEWLHKFTSLSTSPFAALQG